MSAHDSFMKCWCFLDISEKQRLMQQFLEEHGEQFSADDFVRFLAGRYDGVRLDYRQEGRRTDSTLRPA